MERGQSDDPETSVTPLENTAFFAIETEEGYVRIEQSHGNRVHYTPEEAADIAEAIRDAAAEATEDG